MKTLKQSLDIKKKPFRKLFCVSKKIEKARKCYGSKKLHLRGVKWVFLFPFSHSEGEQFSILKNNFLFRIYNLKTYF